MRTFSRAHEELIPLGSVIGGEEAVKDYYDGSWSVFPDQRERQFRRSHSHAPQAGAEWLPVGRGLNGNEVPELQAAGKSLSQWAS